MTEAGRGERLWIWIRALFGPGRTLISSAAVSARPAISPTGAAAPVPEIDYGDVPDLQVSCHQSFPIVAPDRQGRPVDVDDLDHAPAGGEGDHGMALVGVAQGQPVGVGVGVAEVGDPGLDLDTSPPGGGCGIEQAFVLGIPAHEAAEQAHVRSLAGVGEGQGSLGVEFHQHPGDAAAHQVAGQAADA
mgnify:CR=1 FL=1